MKNPQRAQYEVLGREADRLRERNPDLAGKIDTAKIQAQQDFSHRFRVREEAKGQRDQKTTSVGGPAQASLWRHLTEEEKGQLSKPAQRDLLLQDISNSNQVLNLGSLPERAVGERSLERLQAEADRLYRQAEEAHHREITATAYEAVGPEPVPPPVVETPPIPSVPTPAVARVEGPLPPVQSVVTQTEMPVVPVITARPKRVAAGRQAVAEVPAPQESVVSPAPVETVRTPQELETRIAELQQERSQHKLGSSEFGILTSQIGRLQDQLAVHQHQEQIRAVHPPAAEAIESHVNKQLEAAGIKPEEAHPEDIHEILKESTLSADTPEGTTYHIKGVEHGRTEPAGAAGVPAEGGAAQSAEKAEPPASPKPRGRPKLAKSAEKPGAVVAPRASAGGKAEPAPELAAGVAGRGVTTDQEAASKTGYQPGTVLKKAETGLTLRLEESTKPGQWRATVISPGNLGFRKGQVIGPIKEETLGEFKPVGGKKALPQEQQQAGIKHLFLNQLQIREEAKEISREADIRGRRFHRTPLEKENLDRLQKADTGTPLKLTGFRYEVSGTAIPETGRFYTVEFPHAFDYGGHRGALTATKSRQVIAQNLKVDSLEFKNPLIIKGGHNDLAMNLTEAETPAYKFIPEEGKKAILAAMVRLAKQRGEQGYILYDKAIAQAVKAAGFDGIVYRRQAPVERINDTEIVDLRGVNLTGFGKQLVGSRLSSTELAKIVRSSGVMRYLKAYEHGGEFPKTFGE